MQILTRNYTYHHNHNSLLLLSMLIVGMVLYYFVLHSKDYLLIQPKSVVSNISKVVSITLTKAPTLERKKVMSKPKIIKKVTPKKKIIKKATPKKKIKKIIKPKAVPILQEQVVAPIPIQTVVEEVSEELVKEVVFQKAVPVQSAPEPIFDAKMKEEFIAGLYHILNEKKHYPKMAKRRHLEGVSHVSFKLLKNGKLVHTYLSKSCGHSILDKAALKLVQSIHNYKPIPDEVSLAALDLNIPIKYSR